MTPRKGLASWNQIISQSCHPASWPLLILRGKPPSCNSHAKHEHPLRQSDPAAVEPLKVPHISLFRDKWWQTQGWIWHLDYGPELNEVQRVPVALSRSWVEPRQHNPKSHNPPLKKKNRQKHSEFSCGYLPPQSQLQNLPEKFLLRTHNKHCAPYLWHGITTTGRPGVLAAVLEALLVLWGFFCCSF